MQKIRSPSQRRFRPSGGITNTVKMFMWCLIHNSLAVRRNLARRGMKVDTLCPMCQRLDENPGHLFFKCKAVKECWRNLNLEEHRLTLSACQSGRELMQKIWSLSPHLQMQIVVLFWKWWSVRNKVNAGEKKPTSMEICSLVIKESKDNKISAADWAKKMETPS